MPREISSSAFSQACFDTWLDKLQSSPSRETTLDMNDQRVMVLEQARRLWNPDDTGQTYAIYEHLLHERADDALVLREYGRAVYAAYEDFEKATLLFEQSLEFEPGSAITLSRGART